MKYQDPDLCELLAAEYVLGTLKGGARRRFQELLSSRSDLRSQVEEWELRRNRLAQDAPPVSPPAKSWEVLRQRLFPESPWYQRLGFWRGLSITSTLLAGVLVVVLLINPAQESPGYVIMINSISSQEPMWIVSTSVNMGRLHVKNLRRMDMPEGLKCLLWLRPEDSDDYYPLGVLPDQGDDKTLSLDQDVRSLLPGRLLVTVENKSDPIPSEPSNLPAYEAEWLPLTEI